MTRASNLIALLVTALVAALAFLNWSTLMAPAPLDLVIAQIQAPLGVVMLGVAGLLAALFFVAYLSNQIGSLLETRRLLKEIQRVQALADKSEASRIESLQQMMGTEFRQLNERLNSVLAGARAADAPRDVTQLTPSEAIIRGDQR
jgi:uncharacterized integral membrane protein